MKLVDSIEDGCHGDAEFSGPLGLRLGSAVESKEYVLSGIIRLLSTAGPSAVIRRIRPVVVYSFDGLASIVETGPKDEGCNIVPFLDYVNAASTVAVVAVILGVVAAGHHLFPYSVDTVLVMAVFCDTFKSQAAATSNASVFERCPLDDSAFTAAALSGVAVNAPHEVARLVPSHEVGNFKSIELLARQVFEKWVSWFSVGLSHLGTSIADLIRAVSEVRFVDGLFFYTRMEICSQWKGR